MFRYKLRTLLILMAVGPPILAWLHWKLVPRQPSPHLIAISWKLRNGGAWREYPSAVRERYSLDEETDGSALLVDKLTGKQWERAQDGLWRAIK
jgi:hypothetical protein